MPNCEKYQIMISQYIDGELSAEQEAELRTHVSSCPDCADVFRAFSGVSSVFDREIIEAPEELVSGVMFKIRMQNEKKKKRGGGVWKALTAAACIALVAFGAYYSGMFGGAGESDTPNDTLSATSNSESAGGSECYDFDIENVELDGNLDNIQMPDPSAPPPDTEKIDEKMYQFGSEHVDMASNSFSSNEELLDFVIDELFTSPAAINLYSGAYDKSVSVSPQPKFTLLYEFKSEDSREKLREMIKTESVFAEVDEALLENDPIYTLVFFADKTKNEDSQDVAINIWDVDGKLVCLISNSSQIEFSLQATPADLEAQIKKLTEQKPLQNNLR